MTASLALYQLDHVRLILRISKTLAGKSLANQRSIRQICPATNVSHYTVGDNKQLYSYKLTFSDQLFI